MEFLKELNEVGELRFKEYKKLTELEENKKYRILNLERIKAKFGLTIIAELEEFKVNLPNRFVAVLDDKKIKEMNKKDNLHLIKIGTKEVKDKECAMITFVE
uniref:Uncharacterized protein n=1 Tax=Graphocephala atropunctata TaxID=36148 RepID=A0A1B6KJU8_9HEMI